MEVPELAFSIACAVLADSVGLVPRRSPDLAGAEVGRAHILLSGHFHHLRVESISRDKTWVQLAAVDNGSPWFKNRKGADSPSGMVSFRLTPDSLPYWTGLVLHSA